MAPHATSIIKSSSPEQRTTINSAKAEIAPKTRGQEGRTATMPHLPVTAGYCLLAAASGEDSSLTVIHELHAGGLD
jgi:hypothetical protein